MPDSRITTDHPSHRLAIHEGHLAHEADFGPMDYGRILERHPQLEIRHRRGGMVLEILRDTTHMDSLKLATIT